MFDELDKDRTKKDDDFSKSFDIHSPFVVSSSGNVNLKGAGSGPSIIHRNIGLLTLINLGLFISAGWMFMHSGKNDYITSNIVLDSNKLHEDKGGDNAALLASNNHDSAMNIVNTDILPPCEDPEWCSIQMPKVSYFKFDPPSDPRKWRIAQIQAAAGDQVLLREVIKSFPTHFDYLDGDITFRQLHYAMDMFVDERRDLTPLTSAGRKQYSPEESEEIQTLTTSSDVREDQSESGRVGRRLQQVKITSPKIVNGKLMYPWELEGKHVIPEPYDFRYADRAPIISIGYTAYLKDGQGYYSGSRVGGAFIDRKVFFKHWRQVKDRIEVPFIAVCSLNENWGFLSTMFPNRTAGWGRCCDQPQDKILYDFLDHDKTLMLVSNQHTNVSHPKLLILPRGIPLTWGNTRILVWDSQRLVLKKHKKNKLLFAAASKWGPRPQILACISKKFSGQEFDGHVNNPPQQRLDREEYYIKLAQARFGIGLPGLGYDTFR